MRPTWLVAKYTPDVRRQEPVNVGVLLFADGGVWHRFQGEGRDGKIDGRRTRVKGEELANYKAWVDYWRHAARRQANSPGDLVGGAPGASYHLQFGGEELVGATEPERLLDELYALLVGESSDEDDEETVQQTTERIFKQIGIWSVVTTRPQVPRRTSEGVLDVLRFDYRYDNGRPHLMKAVTIGQTERAWQSAQYAVYLFEKLGQVDDLIGSDGVVLTSRPAEGDPLELLRSTVGTVIDVAAPDADQQLAKVLHV